MSDVNLLNLIGILISLFSYVAILCGLVAHVKVKKNDFNKSHKYFSKYFIIENFYFNNKKYLNSWILNFEYIYTPVLAIVPGIFVIISMISFGNGSMIWLIGYLLEYFIAILFMVLYYRRNVVLYSKTLQETDYNYEKLKKINIEVFKDYSFSVFNNDVPIMRNHAFEHNFKVFEKRYRAANSSFKQYRIIMIFLNRFASLIDTLESANEWQKYVISTSNGKKIAYNKTNFSEQVLLTMQSIVS